MSTLLNSGALACSMDSIHVFMGVMLVLSAMLVSKLFCGYVCPVGTLAEGLSRLGRRFKLPKIKLGGIADILMRSIKYVLLFITFYFTLGTNEVFCRNYDPFFASVTLFGADVTIWMAILAIVLVAGGAIFFTQLWCRYICPLGAISNAFKYFYVFIVFAVIALVIQQSGTEINITILLAALCLIAYTLEIIGLRKGAGVQLLRITRNEELCNSCGLCDRNCPQGIMVSELKVVNHPDCNLCTECVGHCPKENTLGINGSTRFRWLPALITVVLIMTGFILGTNISIPTIDKKWGSKEELKRSKVFEMAGLKHVKCYGSSVSFAENIKQLPGVTGVATHIRDHRVEVMYDSTRLSDEVIRRALFSSAYIDIDEPGNDDRVEITDVYILNYFDQVDLVFLSEFADKYDGIYSFQTSYGDTARVRFFHSPALNSDGLKPAIEGTNLIYRSNEESFSSKGHFKVTRVIRTKEHLTGFSLKKQTFPSYRRGFNNFNQYTNTDLGQVKFSISRYPKNQQLMHYVVNHLGKADEFIVGLVSEYTEDGPVATIYFVKDKTTTERVVELLTRKELTLTYDNGIRENIENPYVFELVENSKTQTIENK